jgi:hypothetical protein
MQLTLFYLLPFIISTGIPLGVGAYCWRRHAETGALNYELFLPLASTESKPIEGKLSRFC